MKRLEDAPKELARALRRLDPEHGIVGRRNSRRAVLAVLSAVRKALNLEFPAIRRKKALNSNNPDVRVSRWEARGYVNDPNIARHAVEYARARIPIQTFRVFPSTNLVPRWALLVMEKGHDPSAQLRKLRGNPRAQKIFLAEQALKELKLP